MNMPKLIPIPIPTKGKGFFTRLWIWRTSPRKWMMAEDWKYKLPGRRPVIVIPKDFIFDGASVPRVLWSLVSPIGLLLIPGLIHDFAYRYDFLWAICVDDKYVYKHYVCAGRKYWDSLFEEVAAEVNGTVFIDFLAMLAIRFFGFIAWRNNRKLNTEEIPPPTTTI